MESEPQEIEVSASLLENTSGVALDIGGSVAKVVYRCNKLYKDGKLIKNTKRSRDVGYLMVVAFPRHAVDTYIQYIADHADLTGNPPQVNSCGYGAVDYKEDIEKKLKAKLSNFDEFNCFGSFLLRIIKESALTAPYHDLDPQGVEEGKADFYKNITFQFISDGLSLPERSEFDDVVNEAVDKVKAMMTEDIRLPCLVVMCGSAFPVMVLRENGTFDCRDIMMLGGRAFLGLASIMTGERDWTNIKKMLNTHDGSTAYYYVGDSLDPTKYLEAEKTTPIEEGNSEFTSTMHTTQDQVEESTGDGTEDPYSACRGMRMFPFGNANIVPRDTIKNGDLLYALFESVSMNIGNLAYNTALGQNLHQVLFCGSFINDQNRTIITREIMWRNLRGHYMKDFNKLVDFRFIRNGGHLGALGAMVNTDRD